MPSNSDEYLKESLHQNNSHNSTLSVTKTNSQSTTCLPSLYQVSSDDETEAVIETTRHGSSTSSLITGQSCRMGGLMVLGTNADSLLNKKDELLMEAEISGAKILLVTEVLPKNFIDPISEKDIIIPGFVPYSNIEETDGRGVAIYVADEINPFVTKLTMNVDFEEQVWIKLSLKGNDKILIGCIYRSGKSSKLNNKLLCSLLKHVSDMNPSHLFTYGDFNFKGIDWELQEGTSEEEKKFVKAFQDSFLYQHVDQNTRFRRGQKPNLLDLMITNEPDIINNIEYLPPIGASDHLCLKANLNVNAEKHTPPLKYRFYNGDYTGMNDELKAVKWHEIMENKSAEQSFEIFSNILNETMTKYIPKGTTSSRKTKKLWNNRPVLRLRKKKKNAFKRFRNQGIDLDAHNAMKQATALSRLTDKLRRKLERKIAKNAKSNPKGFWRYYSSLTKCKADIGDILKPDGSMASGNKEKAEVLNDFFRSVFTIEDVANVPHVEDKSFENPLCSIIFTPDTVKNKLKELNTSKSAGPDGFHPKVLNECAESICVALALIFNKSIHESVLPESWKEADIKPLFKKGKRTSPGNYRPISLTSVVCKVMESIIRDKIVDHLMENELLCDEQHGFVPGRSCITQLLCCIEEWSSLLDQGFPIDIIYLDFKKAFDAVPHLRLLRKVHSFGIQGSIYKWLENFLMGRRQRVTIGSDKSNWANVLSGIPQGSVLGPILFVLFINDIPNALQNVSRIFADDTKAYKVVRTIEEQDNLQEDLNSALNWSQAWQMNFNIDKCHALHMGFNSMHYPYRIDGFIIDSVPEEKDLGVIIDNKLNFHRHVMETVKKANNTLGCIRRSIKFRDKNIMLPLYIAHVRSRLEYASVIWNPYKLKDIRAIEYVQRRATKLIRGMYGLSYEDRLKSLDLPSLQYRRRKADMLEVFKIVSGIDRIRFDKFFKYSTSNTRGHSKKFYKQRCRLDIRKNIFSQRVVNDWNSLPESLIGAEDLDSFKAGLEEFWEDEKFKTPFE